jgi:hypothetical protein
MFDPSAASVPAGLRTAGTVVLFAIAFAWVEASVVIYLRDLYYPEGFAFPLRPIDESRLGVELIREFATLVMLAAVGMMAGRTRWERFAQFAIAFGIWDIFFYLWLAVTIGWPASLFDRDILFLLPLPWIGPVLAPVVVSLLLIAGGLMILVVEHTSPFRPGPVAWTAALVGSGVILWTFMRDTEAGLHSAAPQPYWYTAFWTGAGLNALAIAYSWRSSQRHRLISSSTGPEDSSHA